MPLDGNGTYNIPEPEYPAVANTVILASDWNTVNEDIKSALDITLYRDGQAEATNDIGWGGFKLYNLAAGTLDTDATNFDQVFHNPNFVGSVAVADGVRISGTKGTVTATEFAVNSSTFTWANTTINATATNFNLASTNATWTGTNWSIDTTTTLSLESSTINITANAIGLIGDTTATLADGSTAVTQPISDDSTKIATTHFVTQKILGGSFPVGVGNTDKLLSQDGVDVLWVDQINVDVMDLVDGTDKTKKFHFVASGITAGQDRAITIPDANLTIVGTDTAQTLTNKTYTVDDSLFTLQDNADTTKKARFELSGITAGQTRIVTLADEDMVLSTPGLVYLESFSQAAPAANWDITFTQFSTDYDEYMLVFDGITFSSTGALNVSIRYDLGSGFDTSNSYITGGGVGSAAVLTQGISNNAAAVLNAIGYIMDPLGTTNWKSMQFTISKNYANETANAVTCTLQKTPALVAMRMFAGGGNINTGTARLYGLRKV